MFSRLKSFLLRHELLIIIVLLCALVRVTSLYEPYWYGDEGIYLTLGQGVRHGLQLYRDIHDNKPPLIYLIAAVADTQLWFRVILIAWNSASIVVFSLIASFLFDTKRKIDHTIKLLGITFPLPHYSTVATLIFAILPFFAEGLIPNGEIFMILPTMIGALMLLRSWSAKRLDMPHAFIAGIFFSIGFLIKVPVLFDAFAAGWFFFVLAKLFGKMSKKESSFLARVKAIVLAPPAYAFVAGLAIPIVLSIVYYASIGILQPYLRSALLQNVGYLSSWQTGTHDASNVTQSGLKNRAIALGVFIIATLFFGGLIPAEFLFLLVWFACALFGTLLSERPYPHYLIQMIPLLALFPPGFVFLLRQAKRKVAPAIHGIIGMLLVMVVFALSYAVIRFWHYPIRPYYENFFSYITGKRSEAEYQKFFDPTLPEQYSLARIIVSASNPDDRIFIWGDLPTLYALTHRLPPGRYTSAYHILDFHGEDETMAAILKREPKLILIDTRLRKFPNIDPLLREEYMLLTKTDHFMLYRHRTLITK